MKDKTTRLKPNSRSLPTNHSMPKTPGEGKTYSDQMPWKNSTNSIFSNCKFPTSHAIVEPSTNANNANTGSWEVCSGIQTMLRKDTDKVKIYSSTEGNKATVEFILSTYSK